MCERMETYWGRVRESLNISSWSSPIWINCRNSSSTNSSLIKNAQEERWREEMWWTSVLFLTVYSSLLPCETVLLVFPSPQTNALPFQSLPTGSCILTPCQASPCLNDPLSKPLTFPSPLNLRRCFSIGSDQNYYSHALLVWRWLPHPLQSTCPTTLFHRPSGLSQLLPSLLLIQNCCCTSWWGLNSCPLPQTINVPFSSP